MESQADHHAMFRRGETRGRKGKIISLLEKQQKGKGKNSVTESKLEKVETYFFSKSQKSGLLYHRKMVTGFLMLIQFASYSQALHFNTRCKTTRRVQKGLLKETYYIWYFSCIQLNEITQFQTAVTLLLLAYSICEKEGKKNCARLR